MIEAERTLEVGVPVDQVWSFVEVIPNWAPFLVGFQDLTLVDDRRSVWKLRGDVGVLAREVDIQADITGWEPCQRVEFTLTGLTERITGRGTVELAPLESTGGDRAGSEVPRSKGGGGWLRRIRFALAARLLRRLARRSRRDGNDPRPTDPRPTDPRPTGPAWGGTKLRFALQLTPGGPMAPMVELLMTPMLEPAAQDFLRQLREALEARGRNGGDRT